LVTGFAVAGELIRSAAAVWRLIPQRRAVGEVVATGPVLKATGVWPTDPTGTRSRTRVPVCVISPVG
jgi:hypothetical protein